jgi:hypothetical protein
MNGIFKLVGFYESPPIAMFPEGSLSIVIIWKSPVVPSPRYMGNKLFEKHSDA